MIWRGHQHERRQGKMPWQFDLALAAYIAANGLALYLTRSGDIVSGPGLFGAVFVSEAFGIVITYGLVLAFVLSRGRPWRERAVPMFFSLLLVGRMFAAVVTS